MAPSVEDQAAELALFLDRYREGPHPILWVGAGASAAAGYPTLAGLEKVLRRELPGVDKSGYELADAYVDKYSRVVDLTVLLQRHLGVPRGPAALHAAIARLAGLAAAGGSPRLFTTNCQRAVAIGSSSRIAGISSLLALYGSLRSTSEYSTIPE